MTEVIEAARDAWKRNKQGKRVKKKKK